MAEAEGRVSEARGRSGEASSSSSSSSYRCVWSSEGEDRSKGIVCSVSASVDGRYVFTGASDKTLRVWQVLPATCASRLRCLQTIRDAHQDWIRCVAVSPGGGHVFTGSRDETIRVWRINPGGGGGTAEPILELAGILKGHNDWVRSLVTVDADDSILFSVSDDCTIREWDLTPFSKGSKREDDDGVVSSSAQGSDGVILVDRCMIKRTSPKGIKSLAICPHREFIYIGFTDYTVRCMDINGSDVRKAFKGHTGIVTSMQISTTVDSPGHHLLFTGSDDHTVRQWCTGSAVCLKVFSGHSGWIRDIKVWSRKLFSCSEDNKIFVWSLDPADDHRSAPPPHEQWVTSHLTLEGHTAAVWQLAITPDCRLLVSSSADGRIKAWGIGP
ncbi:WD40 repeat domain-containing protein [Chloropicon primus]|uniref:WD40 repeat domain-containing protein n=1 Tax=Chloropicon primus TaxID=1764295 RepID=A0A5B8MW27_9CHLO|nr:WD40 repeat domain-containing protein [Chloropicon primus]UPR04225.1 WD40 repeat domain-containing protein [Chloropicon primus]|eukprot:QDZ25018.1 WD40 repeat domain-containing protein [Chloropicon primus]